MQLRLPRRLLRLAACGVAVTALLAGDAAAAPRRGLQLGVFTTGRGARVDAVLAGIHEGLRRAGIEADVLEKTAPGDPALAHAAVTEFAFEGVAVVFALGPDAACLARDALRDTSVVFASVGYPEDLGLPGRGNVCGVASGVAADEIVETVWRVAPSAERLGLLAGSGAEESALRQRVAVAARAGGLEPLTLDPAEPGECDAIWIAPSVSVREVDALSRALRGRRVALVGSTRGHLDAGCSVVLRTDPTAEGLQAAALARRVLDGEAPQEAGVRHLHRHRLEVNLDAARRLGHAIPLPVLAAADFLSPALGRRR